MPTTTTANTNNNGSNPSNKKIPVGNFKRDASLFVITACFIATGFLGMCTAGCGFLALGILLAAYTGWDYCRQEPESRALSTNLCK